MSAYTDALAQGRQRVNELNADYSAAVRGRQYALAATIQGELKAARAHLQGMVYAGEVFTNEEEAR